MADSALGRVHLYPVRHHSPRTAATLGAFLVTVTNADTTNWGRTQLRKDGASTSALTLDTPPAGSGQNATSVHAIELQTSTAQVIEYQRVSSGSYADCDISVEVLGFTE